MWQLVRNGEVTALLMRKRGGQDRLKNKLGGAQSGYLTDMEKGKKWLPSISTYEVCNVRWNSCRIGKSHFFSLLGNVPFLSDSA